MDSRSTVATTSNEFSLIKPKNFEVFMKKLYIFSGVLEERLRDKAFV
ncbi:hypothetical protein PL9631_1580003 [Planktothrix paucivesiculata PCC 9631]|uniref:Uncharacterized protein n=1 Tax=Planktothrix paucivesiculata PCC 9631 TaxID=671071 RepID=A0A7Z9DYD6_9CYAN|nr:hypothetical protein PL9631_1580003 [Planktothrix paucivesiculata PCC 9631]